jgi:dienelactone hydrolase
MPRTPAPRGTLSTFTEDTFEADGRVVPLFRKGSGPCVLVITEIPGITPEVLGFADRVVALGCTAVLPNLFGEAGRETLQTNALDRSLYGARTLLSVCVSREFTLFATGRSSPVVDVLRKLAVREHARCGGPGVGVVGMCLTGGFALAMAAEPCVIAPVLSQPSMPLGVTAGKRASIDCNADDLQRVADRCAREGLRVLGLRFPAATRWCRKNASPSCARSSAMASSRWS